MPPRTSLTLVIKRVDTAGCLPAITPFWWAAVDGKGARRGQPEAAKHRCFNRYLNGVNLAPSNGEALSEDITTVAALVRGLLSEDDEKVLKLFGNFYYSPEKGLCICRLLLDVCCQPNSRLICFSNSLLGCLSLESVSVPGWWSEFSFLFLECRRKTRECLNVQNEKATEADGKQLHADVWRRSIIGFCAWICGSHITCATVRTPKHTRVLQRTRYYNSCAGFCDGGVITVIRVAVGGNWVLLKAQRDSMENKHFH